MIFKWIYWCLLLYKKNREIKILLQIIFANYIFELEFWNCSHFQHWEQWNWNCNAAAATAPRDSLKTSLKSSRHSEWNNQHTMCYYSIWHYGASAMRISRAEGKYSRIFFRTKVFRTTISKKKKFSIFHCVFFSPMWCG